MKIYFKNSKIDNIITKELNVNCRKRLVLKKGFFKNKYIIMFNLFILALFVGVTLTRDNNFIEVAYNKVLNSAGIYTKEVKSIEFDSGNYNEEGSWKITKSAKWLSESTALIEFNLDTVMKNINTNNKDVILVIDVSGSMDGEKLNTVKNETKDLIEYLLKDNNNKVALITFNSTSNILSKFTNKKNTLLELIDNLEASDGTNYNAAYENIYNLMENYTKEENKDVMTLFLTDSYSNINIPNHVGLYDALKEKYSYMTINGIQYELGTDIIDEIAEITDNQWVASQDNLKTVLFEATFTPALYDSFTVTDFINTDYFYVSNESDITVTQGNATFDEKTQKISWNLGENAFTTGEQATMKIKVNLNSNVSDDDIYLSTNTKESVTYKLLGDEKTINNSSTPVLKTIYNVIYDSNMPSVCNSVDVSMETYKTFSTVKKKTDELTCNGYLFKGWEIDQNDSQDITIINDDSFFMPEHDVTIRGTWTKQSITKKTSGTVYVKDSLYRILKTEATSSNNNKLALEYTGNHQDSIANNGNSTIYYYSDKGSSKYAKQILDKNNVIFAGQCWQIIRTTDTGGVKLIYNGEAENNQCLSTRGTHIGYSGVSTQTLSGSYYYGTDYTYDKTSETFTLDGDLLEATWNDDTYSSLLRKYTCMSNSSTGSCSTLYYVDKYSSSTSAYVLSLDSNSAYSQFGVLKYNTAVSSVSPAHVGYKYGDGYGKESSNIIATKTLLSNTSLSTSYYYSDDILYDSSTGEYTLTNPITVDSEDDFSNLGGYYTFISDSNTSSGTTVYYIAGVSDSTMYYVKLSNGKTIDDYTITIGDSYIDNGNGRYTLNDTTIVKYSDWFNNYSNYINKYTCGDSNVTCKKIRYITSITNINYSYINSSYRFGSSVTWNGSTYTLVDPIEYDEDSLSTHHYTCLEDGSSCTSVKYIFNHDGVTAYYINLKDGTKNIEEALNYMFTDNTTDSEIKVGIEAWYEKYLLEYSAFLEEDTIFCNDRSISSYGGWNSNGGSLSESLKFQKSISGNLSCTNETDKFSVSNPVATLKYPIGLVTTSEMYLFGSSARKTSLNYWVGTPNNFATVAVSNYIGGSSGAIWGGNIGNLTGVRPSIVLKSTTDYYTGDGSKANPYIIDTSGE